MAVITPAQAAPQQVGVLDIGTLAGMTPSQRRDYLASVSPNDAAAAQQAVASARAQANADYLMRAEETIATCPPTSGGISQPFVAGQTLIYNLPTAEGGMIKELLISVSINVTLAAGTGATYAATAGGAIAGAAQGIDTIEVNYNGVQAKLRPMLAYMLEWLKGYGRSPSWIVNAGNSDATIGAALKAMSLVAGTTTWLATFRVRLNALHPHDPAGILPSMGSVTPGFVKINCAQALMGNDPIYNTVYASGGTGNAVTVNQGTSTFVKVEAIYTDGTHLGGPVPLLLDLAGEPTCQYIMDQTLQPLAAGSIQRQKIATLQQHYYAISIVVDGQQAQSFSTVGNLIGFELDKDSVGQNKFAQFGAGTNISVYDYYERLRNTFGQDMPVEGIIPWVAAPAYGSVNADNRNGKRVLNMTPGGWTDVHHAYQLTAVGGLAGATPRVETYVVSLNPEALVKA